MSTSVPFTPDFPRRFAVYGEMRSIVPEMDRLLPAGDMMSSALTEFRLSIVMTTLDDLRSLLGEQGH